MTWNVTPAIDRQWNWDDNDASILTRLASDMHFDRGLGEYGSYVEHVEHECPVCGNDEMVREVEDNIDAPRFVAYWCLNPTCRHFVSDELDWATGSSVPTPDEAPVHEETAVCPDCGETHRIVVDNTTPHTYERRDEVRTERRIIEDAPVALCDDCQVNRAEEQAGV